MGIYDFNDLMNDSQLSTLWAFCRGDLAGDTFEKWCFDQSGLEESLGHDLHWSLLSADYADRDEVWKLRQSLTACLDQTKQCECFGIRDVAVVPMGADFKFERVFQTLERMADYGPDKWWLYIDKCKVCSTVWLIAQDDRIYDDFFFRRVDERTLASARTGDWPEDFSTYESVLSVGRTLSRPPRFSDPMAGSLQWSVEDLLRERPAISIDDIANLLGLSIDEATRLVRKVRPPPY